MIDPVPSLAFTFGFNQAVDTYIGVYSALLIVWNPRVRLERLTKKKTPRARVARKKQKKRPRRKDQDGTYRQVKERGQVGREAERQRGGQIDRQTDGPPHGQTHETDGANER